MAHTLEKPKANEYNPAEKLSIGEQAALDQAEASLRSDGFTGLDDSIGKKEADEGQNSSLGSDSSFDSSGVIGKRKNRDGSTQTIRQRPLSSRQQSLKLTGLLKSRLGVMGLITSLGLGGGLLVAFFGPASMLVNLSQNLSINNDSSSTVLERRLHKHLNALFSSDAESLCTASNSIKCKMGRLGNNTLRKMAKKGIVPLIDGKPMQTGITGYAKQNPTRFAIYENGKPVMKGGKPLTIATKDLAGFLDQKENRKYRSLVYGRTGAIKMNVRAWYGEHITKGLFQRFKLSRAGGIVAKAMKGLSIKERTKSLSEKIPKLSGKSATVVADAKSKIVNSIEGKSKKAGAAYTLAFAGCALLKAPKIIGAAVAAVQLASVLMVVTDHVLGPGTTSQMQGIDDSIEFTGEDASAAATPLTETTRRESDGKMTSALDSSYLLTALGISSTRLPVSNFVPGYSIMQNPAMQTVSTIEDDTKEACNVVMSPSTMYGVMAGNAIVTVAASTTIVAGIVKVVGEWAIASAASAVAGYIVGAAAETAINAFIDNLTDSDAIDSATGEKLGDIIGIGATAFFASGAMSRFIPGLSMKGLFAFNEMQREQEELQKEMDIASLSPFDTSSRYTFLGSIVHNMQMAMLQNNSLNNSLSSILTNLLSIPSMALSFSSRADAATNISTELCGYAGDFGFDTSNPETTPAINMAGMPCTGITPEMDSMATDEAIEILEDEKWIDTSVEIMDGKGGIEDLVESGFIVKDTPMTDIIDECGDSSTGNYLFTNCTIPDGDGSVDSEEIERKMQNMCMKEGDETICYSDTSGESSTPDAPSTKSLLAAVVFLIDYQVATIISGEDDGDGAVTGDSSSSSTADLPPAEGKIVSPIPDGANTYISAGYGSYPKSGDPHYGVDFAMSGWKFQSICDGEIVSINNKGDYNSEGKSGSTNYVWIKCNGSGIYVGYAHYFHRDLESYIKVGAAITAGTPIAKVGNQGNSSGTHLHFQINPKSPSGYNFSSTVNPFCYLRSQGVAMNYTTPKGHRGC